MSGWAERVESRFYGASRESGNNLVTKSPLHLVTPCRLEAKRLGPPGPYGLEANRTCLPFWNEAVPPTGPPNAEGLSAVASMGTSAVPEAACGSAWGLSLGAGGSRAELVRQQGGARAATAAALTLLARCQGMAACTALRDAVTHFLPVIQGVCLAGTITRCQPTRSSHTACSPHLESNAARRGSSRTTPLAAPLPAGSAGS